MLDEVLEQTVREAPLVGPCRIAEDAAQLRVVCGFDGAKRGDNRLADVFRDLADVFPVSTVRNGKAVVLGKRGKVLVAPRELDRLGGFLVVDIGDSLEEEQGEDILLVGAGVDVGAQQYGSVPQIGVELILRDPILHRYSPPF